MFPQRACNCRWQLVEFEGSQSGGTHTRALPHASDSGSTASLRPASELPFTRPNPACPPADKRAPSTSPVTTRLPFEAAGRGRADAGRADAGARRGPGRRGADVQEDANRWLRRPGFIPVDGPGGQVVGAPARRRMPGTPAGPARPSDPRPLRPVTAAAPHTPQIRNHCTQAQGSGGEASGTFKYVIF